MKHFEILWEEAEQLADTIDDRNSLSAVRSIRNSTDTFLSSEEPDVDSMGEILFALCYLSKKHNINVYAELQKIVDEKKVEHYG